MIKNNDFIIYVNKKATKDFIELLKTEKEISNIFLETDLFIDQLKKMNEDHEALTISENTHLILKKVSEKYITNGKEENILLLPLDLEKSENKYELKELLKTIITMY